MPRYHLQWHEAVQDQKGRYVYVLEWRNTHGSEVGAVTALGELRGHTSSTAAA